MKASKKRFIFLSFSLLAFLVSFNFVQAVVYDSGFFNPSVHEEHYIVSGGITRLRFRFVPVNSGPISGFKIWLKKTSALTSGSLDLALYQNATCYVGDPLLGSVTYSYSQANSLISFSGSFVDFRFSNSISLTKDLTYCLALYDTTNPYQSLQYGRTIYNNVAFAELSHAGQDFNPVLDLSGWLYYDDSPSNLPRPVIAFPSHNEVLTSSTVSLIGYCVKQSDLPSGYIVDDDVDVIFMDTDSSRSSYSWVNINCNSDNIFVGTISGLWNGSYYLYARQSVLNPDNDLILLNSELKSVVVDEVNNSNLPPEQFPLISSDQAADYCSETDNIFSRAICRSFVWLFYPSPSILQKWESVKTQMQSKIPFAYFYQINKTFYDVDYTTSEPAPTLSLDMSNTALNMGQIEIFSPDTVKSLAGSEVVNLLRGFMVASLYVLFATTIYFSVRGIFKE